ncbi:FlxA-like family protein [Robertmurraya korlensis]|uniref:FlxA-like family protein n=1 Tax=Robertmurraya korlensis TaxID=519977 RepID=UPI00203AE8E5|nr:FlxA-like family protein [Robertmurraya korlensis]MCM3601892.1 FlxA-like family protein [Robertmurraya korlensis]
MQISVASNSTTYYSTNQSCTSIAALEKQKQQLQNQMKNVKASKEDEDKKQKEIQQLEKQIQQIKTEIQRLQGNNSNANVQQTSSYRTPTEDTVEISEAAWLLSQGL